MLRRSEHRTVPFPVQQIFDLVADVEKYPEFVPLVSAARIRWRHEDAVEVDMQIGLGPAHHWIHSRGVLAPPEHIDITSHDAPFERFNLHWSFAPTPSGGTLVGIAGEFEFDSALMESIVGGYAAELVPMMANAFVERAQELYGKRSEHRHSP